jgi:hypothetical protein
MTANRAAREAFTIQSTDPGAWRELAQILRIAANPLQLQFLEIAHLRQTDELVRLQMLAYVKGYMLLTGLAFENLLKAIALSRQRRLQDLLKMRGGHGLLAIADSLTLDLAQEERDFFRRLEEYVVWAGKYPVSLAAEAYVTSDRERLLSFRSDDPELSDSLFHKLDAHVGQSA